MAVEDQHALEAWLAILPERERVIMRLRFAEGLRQSEIGERLGVSQMHVSRLIRQSLDALRDAAERAHAGQPAALGALAGRRELARPR